MIGEANKRLENPNHRQERVAFDSALFTRKQDYLNTLEILASTLLSDLQKVSRQESAADSFAVGITEIEERGATNFEILGKANQGRSAPALC